MTVPVFDFVGKKKICIICEGYEEKEYLERLKSFGAWQGRYYDVHLVNAKSISNIAPRYQEIFMSGSYDLVLVFCDTDCYPYAGYNEMKRKIDAFHGRVGAASSVVYYANPCILQIVVMHFADIMLTSAQKSRNGRIIEDLVGIEHYQAHEKQREALMNSINKQNFKDMMGRIKVLSNSDTEINSTNFAKLIRQLNSNSTRWVDIINKKLFG